MRRMGVLLAAVLLCGCGRTAGADAITVVVREEGSGTRAAFGEVFGLEERDVDPDAVVTNSTSVVKLCVAGDPGAVGYLSYGALDGSVRALAIDGVAPTAASLADGSYPVMRSFYLAAPAEISPAAVDFLQFIASEQGQRVTQEAGFVPQGFAPPEGAGGGGERLVIAGSSSVAPLCEALRAAYLTDRPERVVEIQISDSSTGAAALAAGICDLAMLSRTPTEGEGAAAYAIARDALAVIVHPDHPARGLSSAQVRALFGGKAVSWHDLLGDD